PTSIMKSARVLGGRLADFMIDVGRPLVLLQDPNGRASFVEVLSQNGAHGAASAILERMCGQHAVPADDPVVRLAQLQRESLRSPPNLERVRALYTAALPATSDA